MSRNYGVGYRDLHKAGKAFLKQAFDRKDISGASYGTLSERWRHFSTYAKEHGIHRLEQIDRESVVAYGQHLAAEVDDGELSVSYAQNLVSAVNSVMRSLLIRPWTPVSPVADCQIPQRCHVRTEIPGSLDRAAYDQARSALCHAGNGTGNALVGLARELGLRSEEASLLDARAAHKEAVRTGSVTITLGTKGGRKRTILITNDRQLSALHDAAVQQGKRRSLMPVESDWKRWRAGGLRTIRETVQRHTGHGLHDLRAAYACERYQDITGYDAPVVAQRVLDRNADLAARKQISTELGHDRISVVSNYIGGRS